MEEEMQAEGGKTCPLMFDSIIAFNSIWHEEIKQSLFLLTSAFISVHLWKKSPVITLSSRYVNYSNQVLIFQIGRFNNSYFVLGG